MDLVGVALAAKTLEQAARIVACRLAFAAKAAPTEIAWTL
jgi:hypothetical protein